ncbi:endopeptidase La [Candidatus Mycoplasma pogonae]
MTVPFITKFNQINFPGNVFEFKTSNPVEILAIEEALASNGQMAIFYRKKRDSNLYNSKNIEESVHKFGSLAEVKLRSRTKKTITVIFSCYEKAMIMDVLPSKRLLTENINAIVAKMETKSLDNHKEIAKRIVLLRSFFEPILENKGNMSNTFDDFIGELSNMLDEKNPNLNPYHVISVILDFFDVKFNNQYDIFVIQDIIQAFDALINYFKMNAKVEYGYDGEFEVETKNHKPAEKSELEAELEREIDREIRDNLDQQQREFILREKIKVIRKKLGDDTSDDEDEFREKINNKKWKYVYPENVQKVIFSEKRRLKGMMVTSPEANISRTYLDWIKNLPWRRTRVDILDIENTKKILDKYHYGLKEAKERIVEFIAVLKKREILEEQNNSKNLIKFNNEEVVDLDLFNNDLFEKGKNKKQRLFNNVPIITLLGPPGTGKTSLATAIAEAMGRKFVKISLGGVRDESEIRGHRRTYVGAMPGKVVQAIKKAGVSNPLILLDEIDKMASDHKGDPSSAMLEVLDPEQNAHFQDHYLELEYDLSKVLFIATANYYESIPEALLDRVEIIELSSYTSLEKIEITQNHLIGRTLKQNSLEKDFFKIGKKEIEFIIQNYTREAGVRELKRVLDKIARKIVLLQITGKLDNQNEFKITQEKIVEFLGIPKYTDDQNDTVERVGVVNGLAYTQYGGSTLAIEIALSQGKGELKITGQLKEIMQESAQIALSYVRSNAEKFGINDFDWDNTNIHIHVPEGAVPKDGPSAGVTFTTAIISALTKKPVSHKIGMTGEITLRGKVLKIGGLKEKTLAALKYGINKIFIPQENENNIEELADQVKAGLEIIPVSKYEEIFENIFK